MKAENKINPGVYKIFWSGNILLTGLLGAGIEYIQQTKITTVSWAWNEFPDHRRARPLLPVKYKYSLSIWV